MTQNPREQLLCELHAHTVWSDGLLTVAELVDLYGSIGFDVLCVTDHIHMRAHGRLPHGLRAETFDAYVEAIDREAKRARAEYGMVVVPGAELTVESVDPYLSAHAVAIGLRRFVSVDHGLDYALVAAREAGAALIAAHPSGPATDGAPSGRRATRRFWHDLEVLRPLVDRFELFNRHELFSWVAEERLPVVATGDFHVPGHLAGWKTLVSGTSDEDSVVAALRSRTSASLVPFVPEPSLVAA